MPFYANARAMRSYNVVGEPWFRAIDGTSILGYARPRDAIRDHIPEKHKNTCENLTVASGSRKSLLLDHNEKIAMYISEPSLYNIIVRNKCPATPP